MRDRAISSKFSTHRVSNQCTLGNFQKKISLTKNGGHFEFFEFLPTMEKHKFAFISLTMRDRVISSKFSIHRVFKKCTISNFQKNFLSPKMVAILNFRIFAKNGKHKFASSLTMRDRAILSKFSTHRVAKQCTLDKFQKKFLSTKMAAILNFQSFAKNGKTQICFYLLNHAR